MTLTELENKIAEISSQMASKNQQITECIEKNEIDKATELSREVEALRFQLTEAKINLRRKKNELAS